MNDGEYADYLWYLAMASQTINQLINSMFASFFFIIIESIQTIYDRHLNSIELLNWVEKTLPILARMLSNFIGFRTFSHFCNIFDCPNFLYVS